MMKLLNNPLFVAILLAALLLLAYGHTFNFSFQFDDYNVIVDAPKVHGLSAWWQSMPGMRPLLKLSYALNWQLEHAPRFFRAFNLFCHFATSILVWKLCLQLLLSLQKDALEANRIALLTACLFALHPAHTEVVTYISSRSTGLMTLLCMASLFYYLRYITQTRKTLYLCASIALWLMAILVKEPALVLPLLAWLIYKIVHPTASLYAAFKTLSPVKKLLLLGIICVPILYIGYMSQYARLVGRIFSLDTLQSQLLSQPAAHMHYLTQTLLGLHLNVDYAFKTNSVFNFKAGLQAALVLACGGMAILYLKRYPLLCFAVLWWFICLIPSNSVIPRLDLVNDRQIYVASIGMLLLAASGFVTLVKHHKLFWLLPALLLACSVYFTWQRNWHYKNEMTLWQASVQQNPNNTRAWNNLGYAYMLDKQNKKAVAAFKNALKLDRNHYKAFYNLQQLNQD